MPIIVDFIIEITDENPIAKDSLYVKRLRKGIIP